MRKRAYSHGTLVREKNEAYRTVSIDPRAVASLGTSSVVSSMSLFSHYYLRRASRRLRRSAAANDYSSLGVPALITDRVNVRATRGYTSARRTGFDIYFLPRVGQVSSSLSPRTSPSPRGYPSPPGGDRAGGRLVTTIKGNQLQHSDYCKAAITDPEISPPPSER